MADPSGDIPAVLVPLGPCECPGRPHGDAPDADWARARTVVPWDALVDIGTAATEGAGRLALVLAVLESWNLEGDDGPVPVSRESVRLLSPETLDKLAQAVDAAWTAAREALPNTSGAPSRASRRASAQSRPAARAR